MENPAVMIPPEVTAFFDPATFTVSYVVADPATGRCAIVDPVLDFDPASGRTGVASAKSIVDVVRGNDLHVEWILETHVHADHLSAAAWLKQELGGVLAIGARITAVQEVFGRLFNLGSAFSADGRPFDHLFEDDEAFTIGTLAARAIHTPGHTPACMSYLVGDVAFVGDTLFMPDYGTARCDFPGGDARMLYRSIRRILSLPERTRLFLCHDYKAEGRNEYRWETSVGDERRNNIHVHDGVGEDAFVRMRTERDRTLAMPRLLLPSVQVNMRGGELPLPEGNGIRYLKIPVDAL
jgi:glyoxylase-like metal-dependent hydrolase (beta-lactamase superfamily II)